MLRQDDLFQRKGVEEKETLSAVSKQPVGFGVDDCRSLEIWQVEDATLGVALAIDVAIVGANIVNIVEHKPWCLFVEIGYLGSAGGGRSPSPTDLPESDEVEDRKTVGYFLQELRQHLRP